MTKREELTESDLLASGIDHLWLHASPFRALAGPDALILSEGRGCTVKDIQGREYIDGLAGLWLVNVGHGRREIAHAMAAQAATLAYANAAQAATIPSIKLAKRLSELTPQDLSVAFFCSGGSEAVETAIKIAREYHHLAGNPKRFKIIGRRGSYHGATYGAMSVSGARALTDPYFSPYMPGAMHVSPPYCYRCDYRRTYPECGVYCVEAIDQMIEFEGADTVAAVIAEPISASNGIVIPPPEYFPRLREICDRRGVLLIVDEVITGFGRTGKMFASEHWNIAGDIMTVAKGLSSGYAPIGAAICRRKVVEPFAEKKLHHILTFGGHAVACAAALANLDILEHERLVENAAAMGEYLLRGLRTLTRHPHVADVRGLGLLAAVELVADRDVGGKTPIGADLMKALNGLLLEKGLLTRAGHIIHLCPPLCISREQIDRVVSIIDDSLTELRRRAGRA